MIDLMTLPQEQKAGQVFMVHFQGDTASSNAKFLIEKLHIGGIIYYTWANKLSSFEQVKNLSSSLQNLSTIPLLISVDQEGGCVCRLTEGFTRFPSAQTVAQTQNPSLAFQEGVALGQELTAAGINLNLAPVVDINNNPKNPVIKDRSFGITPPVVIEYAGAVNDGMHQTGLLTCLKHFPGHGDVAADSHEKLPILNKSRQELDQMELLPFVKLAPKADAIMTAHIKIPALDPSCPATLSKAIITHLLKGEMQFKGVVITDSLVMNGVLDSPRSGSLAERVSKAAIEAFKAGCDILLLGGKVLDNQGAPQELSTADLQLIYTNFLKAVETGEISKARLDDAISRISNLKQKIHLSSTTPHFSSHQTLSQQIIETAVAQKIWNNEGSGKIEHLTFWSKNEPFPSFGIGHFIWYPKGKSDRFAETFPLLLHFLQKEGASLPSWLEKTAQAPWKNREEFYEAFNSETLKELRAFLIQTQHLQAKFMAQRLKAALPKMIENLTTSDQEKVTYYFGELSKSANGLYALIDYCNFKGEGISPQERYNNHGWGLLQVLLAMPEKTAAPLPEFVSSAKKILEARTQNAPPERNEAQFLPGWLARLATYQS